MSIIAYLLLCCHRNGYGGGLPSLTFSGGVQWTGLELYLDWSWAEPGPQALCLIPLT